jgi:hypothetical protein
MEKALREIAAIGASPMTKYGYGEVILWLRRANNAQQIAREALNAVDGDKPVLVHDKVKINLIKKNSI